MIETYFYRNLFIGCYDCLEESEQILMEEKVLIRMINILESLGEVVREDKMKDSRYSAEEIIESVYENVIYAFLAFLAPDIDHNNTLLYKF